MDYSLLLGIYYAKVDIVEQKEEEKEKIDGVYSVYDAKYVEGPGSYCIGIIDMLQKWDLNKKAERFIKAALRGKDPNGISCVPPKQYQQRFMDKMIEIGIGNEEEDEMELDTRN